MGLVFVHPHQVALLTGFEDLAAVLLVVKTGEEAVFIQLHGVVGRFQMAVVRQGEGKRRGNGFRAGLIGAPALGRQVFQADERALFGMLHGIERSGFVCQRLNVGLAQRNDLIPGKALGVEDGQTVAGAHRAAMRSCSSRAMVSSMAAYSFLVTSYTS